jgi:hypothetical protein
MENKSTPLPIIANVSRVVTKVIDRLAGDRSDYPLLVAAVGSEALRLFGIESRVMYGPAAWIEVLEDSSVVWSGCWGTNFSFWIATAFGEVVDLNTSVAHRKRAHESPHLKALYSPPLLWSAEVPAFYRYEPEGVAELEITEPRDKERYRAAMEEVSRKCGPAHIDLTAPEADLDFPNEAILCPGRKLLDDSVSSFRHFDRALSVRGVPPSPF